MNTLANDLRTVESSSAPESSVSAVSWAAILAGAAIASAATLVLITLGTGLGFASMSPWQGEGASATTFTVMTAIWLIVVQWLSSALGGFLTGRLRTRWVGLHTHEVTFRDTAHGLGTWAVATLVISAIVALSTVAAISGGAKVVAATASGVGKAAAAGVDSIGGYEVDSLFRSVQGNATPDNRGEVLQILARGVRSGDLTPADRKYLAELVVAKAGVPQAEAEQRVNAAVDEVKAASVKAKEAADAARKAASAAAICTALSMLIGAFIAMVAAALGGRERDHHHPLG